VNLVLLIGRFPPGPEGGAEHQAEGWALRLADRHHVAVVTRVEPGRVPGRERRGGFEVVRLPVSRVPGWKTWRDSARIEAAVRALDPPPDLLLCFQSFVSGWAGVRIQRHLGVPAVVWVRGEGEYRLEDSWVQRTLNPGTWRDARAVLVQSEEGRAGLLTAVGRHAPRARAAVAAHLEVVPNGLDLPDLAVVPTRSGGRVLSVGRLIHDKGMDVVIDAVAGVQGMLTLAGTGPQRALLEARARRHGLDVRFAGFVPRERLGELYASAGCVVLAARRGEGLPNVLLEAMAWGRPVVATPVAGVTGLIQDRVNGLLVPPGDPLALRDALARLAQERGLSERLGAEARRTAEGFAWERVRPRLEALLERWRKT
jgi:glycosyltransferase involved in cell wall biosynthesis